MITEQRIGVEPREIVKEKTVGEKLGWENMTSDTKKVQDVELLSASAYDVDFVAQHHRVSDLLEANIYFKLGFEISDIYKLLKDSNFVVEKNEEIPIKENEIDIRQLAYFLKILKNNEKLGKFKIQESLLKDKFFKNEEIKIEIDNKKTIDLKKKTDFDEMSSFDFEDYFNKIKEYQSGLQFLGGLTDVSLKGHHAENSGHAQFFSTGFTDSAENEEFLWLPVSKTMAVRGARVDLQKTSPRFRAEGHVHEVGDFNEDTGATVKFHRDLLIKHRGEISTDRIHEITNPRMFRAAVALGSEEEFHVYKDKEDDKINVVDIVNNRNGIIYKALHKTYDQQMIDFRGFPLEEDEADDKIFTDILAPFITANPRDWQMCLAKSMGTKMGYNSLNASKGESWEKFNFVILIRCKDLNSSDDLKIKEYKFKAFQRDIKGVEKPNPEKYLMDYLNARIEMGDIEGVDKALDLIAPMTEAERLANEEEEEDDDSSEEENTETLTLEEIKNHGKLLVALFDGMYQKGIQEFVDNGFKCEISLGRDRKSFDVLAFEKLKNINDSLILNAVGESGDGGIKKVLLFYERLSLEARKELFIYWKSKTNKTK